jgi:hypothetical protein
MSDINTDILEFMDLMDYTLGIKFVDKWRHRFSESFIKHFQAKLLDSMSKRKPLKLSVLFNYLTRKCKYSEEQVRDFFEEIDITLYTPFIVLDLS